ncbi:MAG: bifunctional DNA-formamidopyrimidine glycosylase/DNA-(apurinic or apyrimidinic site) lyase [Alphaproteobacteria bacterium]
MPELPEVEIVCRGMDKAVTGKEVSSVKVNRYDLRVEVPEDFGQRVTGKVIKSLSRRGKYIIINIDDDLVGVLHLGMSGRVRIFSPSDEYDPQKHDHIIFNMDDGTCFAFEDPRRFGMFYLAANDWEEGKRFSSMGPEPLDDWTANDLMQSISNKKSPIKSALLDQRVVAGLGNIYVCEVLFRSHISPISQAKDLDMKACERIVKHSRDVLNEAIAAGGSTLKDYQHTDGSLGYFQHGFSVYDREGIECSNDSCSSEILRIVQSGRSTFYCPSCQK